MKKPDRKQYARMQYARMERAVLKLFSRDGSIQNDHNIQKAIQLCLREAAYQRRQARARVREIVKAGELAAKLRPLGFERLDGYLMAGIDLLAALGRKGTT